MHEGGVAWNDQPACGISAAWILTSPVAPLERAQQHDVDAPITISICPG